MSKLQYNVEDKWWVKYLKQIQLKSFKEDKIKFGFRLWVGHKQVFEILEIKGKQRSTLVSYVDQITKDDKRGKAVHRKASNGKLSEVVHEQLKRSIHELESIAKKYDGEFLASDYEFELKHNGHYYTALIPKDADDYQNVTTLINLILSEHELESNYQVFIRELDPGSYFDGEKVFTIK